MSCHLIPFGIACVLPSYRIIPLLNLVRSSQCGADEIRLALPHGSGAISEAHVILCAKTEVAITCRRAVFPLNPSTPPPPPPPITPPCSCYLLSYLTCAGADYSFHAHLKRSSDIHQITTTSKGYIYSNINCIHPAVHLSAITL